MFLRINYRKTRLKDFSGHKVDVLKVCSKPWSHYMQTPRKFIYLGQYLAKLQCRFTDLCYLISILKTDWQYSNTSTYVSGKSQFWHIESFKLFKERIFKNMVCLRVAPKLISIYQSWPCPLHFLNGPRIRTQNLMKQTVPHTTSSELYAR